jgi:hypothetical protein
VFRTARMFAWARPNSVPVTVPTSLGFDFCACIHLSQATTIRVLAVPARVRILGETDASGTLTRGRCLPATLPPTDRQPFGNIVAVALIIAFVPRYIPRWLYG